MSLSENMERQLSSGEIQLRKNCEDLLAELHQKQKILDACHKPQSINESEPLISVFCEKEKLLKARIHVENHAKPLYLPPDLVPELCELEIDSLTRNNSELQSVMSYIKGQFLEMKEGHQDTQHEQVCRVLEERLASQEEGNVPVDEKRLLSQLERKQLKAQKYYKGLMIKLIKFIQKNFPVPTNDDESSNINLNHHQKNGRKKKHVNSPVAPLENILEVLVNQCCDEPQNPYVTLNSEYWPPFVELLVRSGVAQLHPDDDQKIRITPFHL